MDTRIGTRQIVTRLSSLLAEIERRYPCSDCGAPAGQPCRPEYGCNDTSRLPKEVAAMREP